MSEIQASIPKRKISPKKKQRKQKDDFIQKPQSSQRKIHMQPMSVECVTKERYAKNSSFMNNSTFSPINKISRQTTLAQEPPKKKRVRFADEECSDLCIFHEVESYKEYNKEIGGKVVSCCQICSIY